ncbi:MAG: hypothetical protein ACR2ML_14400 [Solirubrobacteraceae bacterium]
MATIVAGDRPARARLEAAAPPLVMATLVVPSLAITPCLWVALASIAAGGPWLAVQAVAAAGLLLALAGSSATRAHAYACGEHVPAARRQTAACLGLCVIGAVLAAVTAAVAEPDYLAWLTAAVTVSTAIALGGLLAARRMLLLAGVVAVNLVWSIDVAWLVVLGARALLGDACGDAGCLGPLD